MLQQLTRDNWQAMCPFSINLKSQFRLKITQLFFDRHLNKVRIEIYFFINERKSRLGQI